MVFHFPSSVVTFASAIFNLIFVMSLMPLTQEVDNGDHLLWQAEFTSPFVDHLPGLLPKESEKVKFQVLLPKVWRTPHLKPTCLHLAGTGDHVSYWFIFSLFPCFILMCCIHFLSFRTLMHK